MRPVIGIDPSSKKLAFCTTGFFGQYRLPEMKYTGLPEGVLHAAGAAFEEAFLFFQDNSDAVVYMEEPVVGRSAYSTIVQAQVGGAVLAAASKAGMEFHLVNVGTWKKQVVKKGNAKKEEVAFWLKENWPEAYTLADGDQDLLDASAINLYGVQHERTRQAILSRRSRAGKTESQAQGAGGPGRRR